MNMLSFSHCFPLRLRDQWRFPTLRPVPSRPKSSTNEVIISDYLYVLQTSAKGMIMLFSRSLFWKKEAESMNLKIIFFVFIFTWTISASLAIGGSRFSFEGVKSNYGDFTRTLSPLSKLTVHDPLSRLNAEVDAAVARVNYRTHFGSPGYRFYRRSPGLVPHFKSPGYYFRYGYHRPFYRDKLYGYHYRYRPYRHYYKHEYFGYYLPRRLFDKYWHHGLNYSEYNLGLPWPCR